MSNNLGQIYATSKSSEKYIILDSQNVEVSGNFLINGTNSRMPAELENSIRNYLPLTYGTTDPNPNTLYDVIREVSNNLLISNNDASFNDVDISGNLNVKNINAINLSVNTNFGTTGQVLTSNGSGSAVSWEDQIDTTYSAGTGLDLDGTTFNVTTLDSLISNIIPFCSVNGNVKSLENSNIINVGARNTTIDGQLNINSTLNVNLDFGTIGQVLTSGGAGNPVSWQDQSDTTYSEGTGVTINASNEISIGQSVATSDSPSFNDLDISGNLEVQGDVSLNAKLSLGDNLGGFTIRALTHGTFGDDYAEDIHSIVFENNYLDSGQTASGNTNTCLAFGGKSNPLSCVLRAGHFRSGQSGGYTGFDFYGEKSGDDTDSRRIALFRAASNLTHPEIDFFGTVSVYNSNLRIVDGSVGIKTTSPSFPLDVNGDMRVGTTNGGYIYWVRAGGVANRISIRGDYLGSDCYKLEFRVRGFPNSPAMYLQRNGNGNPFLRVNGSASFGSDNRLKHNEVNLVNALDTINKLQPKVYDKTSEMLDEDYNGPLEEGTYNKEVGFIAQEVYEIEELKEYVEVGDENESWGVNYNALFSYNIGATQELYKLVKAQQEQINELNTKISNLEAENISLKEDNTLLKQENTLIKSKLNELLAEAGKETI